MTGDLPAISGANLTGVGVAGITSSADATAITINSSEQVGIGQTSPAELLHLKGGIGDNSTAAPIIRIQKHSGGAVDDGQTIGGMSFWVNDDGVDSGAPKERAKIIAESQNTSSGTRLEFWTGNSNAAIAEQMRIQADGAVIVNNGITLGNGITYAASNTLDDYEEGTWTPTFSGNHIGSHTLNYAIYTKIGRLVKIEAYVYNFGSIGGNGISFGITGLPFTPNQQSMGATTCTHTNVDDSTVNLSARQYIGTIYIEQSRDNAGGGWTPYNDFNGNSHVQISLSYTTAS